MVKRFQYQLSGTTFLIALSRKATTHIFTTRTFTYSCFYYAYFYCSYFHYSYFHSLPIINVTVEFHDNDEH